MAFVIGISSAGIVMGLLASLAAPLRKLFWAIMVAGPLILAGSVAGLEGWHMVVALSSFLLVGVPAFLLLLGGYAIGRCLAPARPKGASPKSPGDIEP